MCTYLIRRSYTCGFLICFAYVWCMFLSMKEAIDVVIGKPEELQPDWKKKAEYLIYTAEVVLNILSCSVPGAVVWSEVCLLTVFKCQSRKYTKPNLIINVHADSTSHNSAKPSVGTMLMGKLIFLLRAKFFRGNINIYLHFVSFIHIDMIQVLKILPQVREGPTHSI